MLIGRFAMAISIVACLLFVGAQKLNSRSGYQQESLSQQVADLSLQVSNLSAELDIATKANVKFQIAATTIPVEGGISFAQVFKVDVQTGYVCQVLGKNAMKGEMIGTSLPYCTQE